jgi:hypothetical protein
MCEILNDVPALPAGVRQQLSTASHHTVTNCDHLRQLVPALRSRAQEP